MEIDPALTLTTDTIIEDVAHGTAGFSGRALAKMMISLQAEAYGNNGLLTKDLFIRVAEWKCIQFKRRAELYIR